MIPVVTLKSGITVANLSSPHPFNFNDGSVLGGCDADRSKVLSLDSTETETPNPGGWTDIVVRFSMTPAVQAELDAINADSSIDIVIVPFPVMSALKESGMAIGKARVCRLADRVAKTVFADKFCI